jgi:hypothetical protein
MYFKRPSFKRGGSTGIAQLTPSRQGYAGGGNIGGGGIGGRNLGTRTGFNIILNEFGLPYEKPPSTYKPNFNLRGGSYVPKSNLPMVIPEKKIPTGGLTKGSRGARLLSQLRGLGSLKGFGLNLPTLGAAAIFPGLPVGMAYANKPETLAEKKVMQEYGPIDETFFDYDKYYADREAASKVGDEISFSDALFMNPETGLYPKMFGRTEDRNKKIELEKLQTAETDAEDGITNYENDKAEAAEQKTALESALDTMIKDKPKDKDKGGDKPEPTFEDTYQTEFDRIQKLIGDDNTKGLTAIALSEAIGTPGTIADKAAVLNKSLLGLMGNKRKDKKEIAMLAYKATKEIEKAKIVADKQTDSAKNFEELKTLNRIIQDDTGTYNEDQKKNARSRLKVIEASIRSLNPAQAQKTMDPSKARETLKTFEKVAKKLSDMDKTSSEYAAALNSYMAQIELLNSYPELMPSIRRLDSVYVGALGKKDGGRIERALGSPETGEMGTMPMSQTANNSETPTAQVSKLSFEELRDRLPPEVTDDVIRFLSQSEQALQDFAYIRTAGDIKKFNMKYGLNLVLPAQA